MCCKKWLKNIYQSICELWFVKLVKRILIPVQSQLLSTIIVICIVVKFFPDKIANFLGIKTDTGEIMSFIELIIEGIFCVLVLKEFKMTRKSFEWQQKEQQEKKDKEIEDKINYICYVVLKMDINKSFMFVNQRGYIVNREFPLNKEQIEEYCEQLEKEKGIKSKISSKIIEEAINNILKKNSYPSNDQMFMNSLECKRTLYNYSQQYLSNKFLFDKSFIRTLIKDFSNYKQIDELYDKLL